MLITVSRQTGSRGREITERLAQKLDLPIITRDLVMSKWFPEIATSHELHMLAESPRFFLSPSSQGITFAEFLEKKLRELAEQQSVIIFGLGAQIIFGGHHNALHVKLMASAEIRTNRIIETHRLAKKDAERFLKLTDRKHKRYISTLYGKDWSDLSLYHITLNTDNLGIEEAASVICYLAQIRRNSPANHFDTLDKALEKSIVFKHPSEEEFASILAMHNIEWQYEPRTFPIEWDTEGNITQAFSPDFYLPRFDTYIELTTMDQKYVSQKKKKAQKLRELYPGTNINIVFKKDFYSLARRFGLWGGSDKK